jgi:hypothetical protein
MKASIVDLRYHMNDVLKALARNESVEVLYHSKKIGIIMPIKKTTAKKVEDHEFYGMAKDQLLSVEEQLKQLRGGRYDDI